MLILQTNIDFRGVSFTLLEMFKFATDTQRPILSVGDQYVARLDAIIQQLELICLIEHYLLLIDTNRFLYPL